MAKTKKILKLRHVIKRVGIETINLNDDCQVFYRDIIIDIDKIHLN